MVHSTAPLFTLKEMSGGEHNRSRRSTTKRFDSKQLAAGTRKQAALGTTPPQRAARTAPHVGPLLPRALTVEDPLTTQLLAEVARRSETLDFDDKVIDEVVATLDKPDVVAAAPHPHTLRRKR
jgi:hypothetical protein